jgi:hypothetical protein
MDRGIVVDLEVVVDREVVMNRRDFLSLSTSDSKRILELSCERLYMRYVDANAGIGRPAQSPTVDINPRAWEGEPPNEMETPTAMELFDTLERELAAADVLRVRDADWLSSEAFGQEVEARVQAFRRRGGKVEFGDAAQV